jgi:hypothetical protein
MASLQLLCTVGGNQARLDARTEFEILAKGGVEAGRARDCIVGGNQAKLNARSESAIRLRGGKLVVQCTVQSNLFSTIRFVRPSVS